MRFSKQCLQALLISPFSLQDPTRRPLAFSVLHSQRAWNRLQKFEQKISSYNLTAWPDVRYVGAKICLTSHFLWLHFSFIFSPVSGGNLTTLLVERGTVAQELDINFLTLIMC